MSILLSRSIWLDKKSTLLYLGITEDAFEKAKLPSVAIDRYSLHEIDRLPTTYRVSNYNHSLGDCPTLVKTCLNKFELLLLLKDIFKSYNLSELMFNNFADTVSENPTFAMVMAELRSLYHRTLFKYFDFDKLVQILSDANFFQLVQSSRNPFINLHVQPKDWRTPPEMSKNAKTGAYSVSLTECGVWHLSDCDTILHKIIIFNCNTSGGLSLYDGTRRLLWTQPSTFTGSIPLEGFCKGGILVDNGHKQVLPINTTINFEYLV